LTHFFAPIDTLKNDPHFLGSLLDASLDGMLAFDRDCRYTAWNQAMERISGVSRADAIGRLAVEVFPFLKESGEDQYFREVLAGRSTVSENRPFAVPETGRKGFFEGHYSPLYDENGIVVGGICIVRDITALKQADEKSRDAHQRLTFHVENSPLAVVEWDSDFRVSRWSESAERLFGWRASEVLGKHVTDWQFVFAEDLPSVLQLTNKQREGFERQSVLHNRNYTRNGSILYCQWYNSVLNDDAGQLVSVLSLVLDVTARKFAEEERVCLLRRERQARREAEDADRLKDEFLATLSHELRTPLTSVLGWASLIRAGEINENNYAVGMETIERNARLQARLIDDLLDVSRTITGNLRLELSPLDLVTVIEAARDTVLPAAEAKEIDIQMAFDSADHIIKGDANRLRQVVWNLLLNAIKFTPRGGRVLVELRGVDSSVRLTVSDSGEGIDADFLPYVFDRFRQAEGSMSRRQGGLGLGLALVRHLVELHGGYVKAESPGKGLGATFSVWLPLTSGLSAVVEGDEQDGEPRIRATDDPSRFGANHRRNHALRLDGLHVLVVEDDADARSLINIMLERSGARVTATSSASEALQAFETITPDVVVSDIGMPDEDGCALIRKVRRRPPERGGLTPAIALTGYATGKDQEQAIAAGYQTHIAKPIVQAELVSAIANLVNKPVGTGR
jgi:PAS domain S-box-containing protein